VIYLVPVLGLVVYKLLDLLGLGMVAHALILALRERRAAAPRSGPDTPGTPGPAPTAPATGPMGIFSAAAGPSPEFSASAASAPPPASPPPAAPVLPRIDPALPRAGFWVRMVALLLDVIIVGIVVGILHLHHLILLALAIYGAILWKARGATLGGIVFDLHVVRVDGRPVDWTTAIVRALGCFLSLAVLFLGFFWIAFDENRQAWHDKFAGTLVVRVAKAASPAQV
jgi:uncharacterized RDD family membrane protein YckC